MGFGIQDQFFFLTWTNLIWQKSKKVTEFASINLLSPLVSSNPFFIHNDLKSLNCTLKSTEVEHQADRKRRYYRDLGRNREVWRNT